MQSSSFAPRISAIVAAVLMADASFAAVAADQPWWQRVEGYAVLGAGNVKATPDSGGTITASFNDNTTVGTDKSLLIEGGRRSNDYMVAGTLGARFQLTQNFTLGLEREAFSFSDAVATAWYTDCALRTRCRACPSQYLGATSIRS